MWIEPWYNGRMRLLEIMVKRELSMRILDTEDQRPIDSISLRLIEAEIFFDRDGVPKLMEREKIFGTHLFNKRGSVGFWKATNEEIDLLRSGGYQLPDWRDLSVADIAAFHPLW